MEHFQASYWSLFQIGFVFISLALTMLLILTFNSKKRLTKTSSLIIWLASLLTLLAQTQMTIFSGILQDELNLSHIRLILFLAGYSLLVFICQTIALLVNHKHQKIN